MRTPSAVFRWLSAGILVTILLFCSHMPVSADTGTYEIQKYEVTLEPLEDGRVGITIDQTWRVLTGNIPWITVGLPNDHFDIESSGLAVKRIFKHTAGGFSGVKIDLDKTYLPGEIFNIRFKVLQNNLLERIPSEEHWRINYTPGWYDRARIGDFYILVKSPVSLGSYTTINPPPDATFGDDFSWRRTNLSLGERFNIELVSTDGQFLSADVAVSSSRSVGEWLLTYLPTIIFLAIISIIIWHYIRKAIKKRKRLKARLFNDQMKLEAEMEKDPKLKKEIEQGFRDYVKEKNLLPDSEGKYYDKKHGYITPALWAILFTEHYRGYYYVHHPYVGPHFGAGTRPHQTSCVACACVSCACACACACAGGGAAGCSRKTLHECPKCTEFINNTTKSDSDNKIPKNRLKANRT